MPTGMSLRNAAVEGDMYKWWIVLPVHGLGSLGTAQQVVLSLTSYHHHRYPGPGFFPAIVSSWLLQHGHTPWLTARVQTWSGEKSRKQCQRYGGHYWQSWTHATFQASPSVWGTDDMNEEDIDGGLDTSEERRCSENDSSPSADVVGCRYHHVPSHLQFNR
ncbi:hypothetical protein C8T65DRAFT_692635 [Cerioporus squamosus]|nr:hypothetical protein C8T65DRAFT_692635 [Cerioporus squamosus]